MEWNTALRWVDAAVFDYTGRSLREPEAVILKGTCRGLTYEQMARDSDYSTNYLMRDVAPKLWKQLSNVFARAVGKTNFCVVLESYVAANPKLESELMATQTANRIAGPELLSDRLPDRLPNRLPDRLPERLVEAQQSLSAIARRKEAEQGWLNPEGNPTGDRIGASLLSVSAMSPSVMYGYEVPLRKLGQWLIESTGASGRSHLIGIWGLRGIGKTLLLEQAIAQAGVPFEGVIWRSLHDRPTLNELSVSLLASLGVVNDKQPTAKLLSMMTNHSLLVVLESAESILQTESLAGDYMSGYENYAEFFQSAANSRSCVVLTGIEGPADWVRRGGYGANKQARSLLLSGLDQSDAIALLKDENLKAGNLETGNLETGGLNGAERLFDQWSELVSRYQGHPLALKLVARVIREMFNGQVDTFLRQSPTMFNGIFQLLSPTFDRLSLFEREILYWLAIGDSDFSLAEIESTLPLSFRPTELLSALDSLKQRSLLLVPPQSDPPMFQLPSLVKGYSICCLKRLMSQSIAVKAPADLLERRSKARYAPIGSVIDLSPTVPKSIQLSQWFQGQFDSSWRSLDWLFQSTDKLAMRLRSIFHLRDESSLKRCKQVALMPASQSSQYSQPSQSSQSSQSNVASLTPDSSATEVVLLVAIQPDTNDLYQICLQAQPAAGEDALPEHLSLMLLGANRSVLAAVVAQCEDAVIQLPYFRGVTQDSFEIAITLGELSYSETFVI